MNIQENIARLRELLQGMEGEVRAEPSPETSKGALKLGRLKIDDTAVDLNSWSREAIEYVALSACMVPHLLDALGDAGALDGDGGEEPSNRVIFKEINALMGILKARLKPIEAERLKRESLFPQTDAFVFTELDFLRVIEKFAVDVGGYLELVYAETDKDGRKLADKVIEGIGKAGGDIRTRQELSATLKALGFVHGRTMKGQKYYISVKEFKRKMALFANKIQKDDI